jgi:hypothetical protein
LYLLAQTRAGASTRCGRHYLPRKTFSERAAWNVFGHWPNPCALLKSRSLATKHMFMIILLNMFNVSGKLAAAAASAASRRRAPTVSVARSHGDSISI